MGKTPVIKTMTSEMMRNLYGNLFCNMLWHCPGDPRFHYRVHLPDGYYEEINPSYKLMVMIHGTGCGLETYFQAAEKFADQNHVALLAPVFPGGQFVNRFLLAYPKKLKAVSISAPGRPTFVDAGSPYPQGTGDFEHYFGRELKLEAIRHVPVQMMVGERDRKFIGESSYGSNRVERLKSLKQNFEKHGIHTILNIIPEIEHLDGDTDRITACTCFFKQFL